MTVICIIKGGLGNQLFQIYASTAYAFKNKHAILFPYQKDMNPGGCTNRPAYWDTFFLALRLHTTYHKNQNSINDANQQIYTYPRLPWNQHHHVPIPDMPPDINTIALDGYFQSYKYFNASDGERFLDRSLKIKERIEGLRELYNLNATYNISMHFRLGDYKRLQHCHTVLDDDYYIAALEKVLMRIVNPAEKPVVVYYLCEQENRVEVEERVAYIQTLFEGRATFKPIPSGIQHDWEELLFMSACDSNIIANSTFSWWAAYWNTTMWKVVCYPRQWFGPQLAMHDLKDMFPDDWVLT
jgi:hypothetical protein